MSSVGLWLAVRLLSHDSIDFNNFIDNYRLYLFTGLVLTLINIFIKPVVELLALPISILSLGLFSVVINGLMVFIAIQISGSIEMNFLEAVFAGIIVGVINFIAGFALGVFNFK